MAVAWLPDEDEVELILSDMAKHYDARIVAYYEAAFFAGFRPEEEIALRWEKIDSRRKTGLIDTARTGGAEKETKNYEVREVEFNDRAWKAIESMRAWTGLKDNEKGHGHVFENPKTGKPWVSEADQRDNYWTPTMKRLRLRRRRAYQTRSTCATLMLEGGADIRYIQEMLGHVELSTTQIYTQVSIRRLKAVHSLTHPSAKIDRPATTPAEGDGAVDIPPLVANKPCGDAAELMAALAAEAVED